MNYEELMKVAAEAKEHAYTPYYNFRVGAAVLTKSGKVYTGCNIENGAGFSLCAERVAMSKAISSGEKEFVAVAVSSDAESFTYPCGVCRQFMVEFAPELDVIVANKKEQKTEKLKNLLPHSFIY